MKPGRPFRRLGVLPCFLRNNNDDDDDHGCVHRSCVVQTTDEKYLGTFGFRVSTFSNESAHFVRVDYITSCDALMIATDSASLWLLFCLLD